MTRQAFAASAPENTGLRESPARLRQHFQTGLAAALRADSDGFVKGEPQSVMGTVVKGLIREAQRGKTPAIRLMFAFLDQAESEAPGADVPMAQSGNEQESNAPSGNSQGHSQGLTQEFEADAGSQFQGGETEVSAEEMPWDWTERGVWNSPERERGQSGNPDASEQMCDAELSVDGKMMRFRETIEDEQVRFNAEPPGSAVRVEQWQASVEALREDREGEDAGGIALRRRRLRIAECELAAEQEVAALRAAGDERFHEMSKRALRARARWPSIYWLAFLGSGVQPAADDGSQGISEIFDKPPGGIARASPSFTIRIAGRVVEP